MVPWTNYFAPLGEFTQDSFDSRHAFETDINAHLAKVLAYVFQGNLSVELGSRKR
ncbi:hypothetical protein GCM10009807_01690 [Microbacterium lacus]|uniref:Uncharacterized protein n=1 Tax=Microbacterium lacus TaxID=415217 RepID=A0ABN2FXM9_9MICO